MSGDHQNDNIIKISQDTEKSPGNLRRLTITQTPVRDHEKNFQKSKIIIIIITNAMWTFRDKAS